VRGVTVHDEALADAAAQLARSLRSGSTLPVALAEVSVPGPAGVELARVAGAVARGVPVVEALAAWRDRCGGDPAVALVVAACAFGHRHGGEPARALEGAAATLWDRADVAREARAQSAQARAGIAVLGALPVVGAGAFALLDPGVAAVLLGTPIGWTCLVVGALLDLAGVAVSRRIVARALS
jgi:tight adherence protein B